MSSLLTARPKVSVVVPCFNEEAVLRETNRRLFETLHGRDIEFEIIYIDDGSSDATPAILSELRAADERVRIVRFSRNFGHQFAITAGIEHARGDAVAIIDADLQDPPEVLLEMIDRWKEGCDVAYGMRVERDGETFVKLSTAKLFYRVINWLSATRIPRDTGDFRLMDRRVVDALLTMPERDRFMRGMVSWLGFRQESVPYHRVSRFAGETKYPFFKMVRFAFDGIFSFSIVPLRLATVLGCTASLLALLGALIAVALRIWTNDWVTGWTSLFLAVLLMSGIQLMCLGIFGEYLGRIYQESKHRPLYVVQERSGFDAVKQETEKTTHAR